MGSDKMNCKKHLLEVAVIGISHKTADVETRECFAIDRDELSDFYRKLTDSCVTEGVYLSTCNRVEVYFASENIPAAIEYVAELLEEYSGMPCVESDNVYKLYGEDAVRHLLTVISSLDSMVVGENEIFSQIKDAFARAVENGKTGVVINKLFHQAFRTAKQVRTETDIARNPLSVAYIAVEQVRKIFTDLSQCSALLIGAGEMGELILKYLSKYEIGDITIANRSLHNAERICRELNVDADVTLLDDIARILQDVDIVISSAGAQHYMITSEIVKNLMDRRGGKDLVIVDIAVPRNIDPEVTENEGVYLYNIDSLKAIADENFKNRLMEVELAKEFIETNLREFSSWRDELKLEPTIVNIQKKFDEIRREELARYRRRKLKHLSDEDFALIEDLTNQIMTKTLHNPIMNLKRHHESINGDDEMRERIRRKTRFVEELFIK